MNNLLIVSGTHRVNGASNTVATELAKLISEHIPNCDADILPLSDIPFWDEGLWGEEELAAKWQVWEPAKQRLKATDGLIFIAPEYAGMVPPKLMNFLLLCSGAEVGHKPALAVGVSASRGGAYPITQLRSYGYKNNHLCWLPDHLILRQVEEGKNPFSEGSYELKYALYTLKLLDQYATALKTVRDSGVIDHEVFPFGM